MEKHPENNKQKLWLSLSLSVFFAFVMLGIFPRISQAATYELNLSLQGDEATTRAELDAATGGSEQEGVTWRRWNAEFTNDGVYFPQDNSVIKIWPQQGVPIQHVEASFDVKGLDDSWVNLTNDTFLGAWAENWCDPCDKDANPDCVNDNWGFEFEKWAEGSDSNHIYDDAVLMRGIGMGSGLMFPYTHGAGQYDWDPNEVYTVEADLNMVDNKSQMVVKDSSGNVVLGLPAVTNIYAPGDCKMGTTCTANINPRDNTTIDIGSSNHAFVGATISNLHLKFEDLPNAESWEITGPSPAECGEDPHSEGQCTGTEWVGSCDLTSPCDKIITNGGTFQSDGWHPDETEAFAAFSSKDADIDMLAVAQGKLAFDVKGLNVQTLPENSLYFANIHRIPWNGCKDDFWYTAKLTGGAAGGTNGQVWIQGFDYAAKIMGTPPGGFPGGWSHFELNWDNTGWTTSINGVGSTSGVMNYELTARDEEILIGVGSEIDENRTPVAEPGNDSGWGYGLFDILGNSVDVAYRNLEWEFKNGSCDNPNAKDSEFCTDPSDDNFGDCGCIGLSDISVAPCSEEPENPNDLDEDLMWFRVVVLGWYWELEDVIDNFVDDSNEQMAPPEVWVQSAAPGLIPGEEMSFLAAAENYRTRYGNMYFAWCVRDSNGGPSISYNSVVAGGEVPEASGISAPSGAGPCCDWITRRTTVDTDNDGMDDAWEREKFVGRQFEGEVLYTSIEEVLPNQDPDADGYYANKFENREEGEYVTITPGIVDSLGNKYIPGGSDSSLTNVEEFVLQTDPLNGDTDGDGFPDEEDYIGVGQQLLEFTADKFLGISDYLDVTVATVGIDQRKLVYITNGTQRVHVSPSEQFAIELASSNEYLPVGASEDTIVDVTAQIAQGDVDATTLEYSWTLQGADICDAASYPDLAEYCGQGKNTLPLGGNGPLAFTALPGIDALEIGDDYTIKVDVIDAVTRQESSDEIRLSRSASLELTTDCEGVESTGEEITTVPAGGETPVQICVGSYGSEIEDERALTFQWYKDGHFQQEQTGIGKSTYDLYGTKSPGQIHTVHLTASAGELQDQRLEGDIKIAVSGPHIEIIDANGHIRNSDSVSGEDSRYLPVSPGETVDLTATAVDFGEQSNYEWTWAGGGDTRLVNSFHDNSNYSFTVPDDITAGDTFAIKVDLRADDGQGDFTDGSAALLVAVAEDSSLLGSGQNLFSNMAAIFSQISPETKLSLQVALLILGALGIIVLVAFVYRHIFVK